MKKLLLALCCITSLSSISQSLPPGTIRYTQDAVTLGVTDQAYVMLNTHPVIPSLNCAANNLDGLLFLGVGGLGQQVINENITVTPTCGVVSGNNYILKSLDVDSTNWVETYVRTTSNKPIIAEYDKSTFSNKIDIEWLNWNTLTWNTLDSGDVITHSQFLPAFFANEDALGFKNSILVRYRYNISTSMIDNNEHINKEIEVKVSNNSNNIVATVLENTKNTEGRYQLFDVSGKIVSNGYYNGLIEIPNNFSKGLYVLKVILNNSTKPTVITKKIYL